MGLSGDQVAALKAVADALGKDSDGNGKALFIKMFEMNPGWIDQFPAWKGKDLNFVKSSPVATSHGGKVIRELCNWLSNIENASGILKGQGSTHKGRTIGIEYFEKVLPVIDATLVQQMKASYTPAMKEALASAWEDVIVPGMKAGY